MCRVRLRLTRCRRFVAGVVVRKRRECVNRRERARVRMSRRDCRARHHVDALPGSRARSAPTPQARRSSIRASRRLSGGESFAAPRGAARPPREFAGGWRDRLPGRRVQGPAAQTRSAAKSSVTAGSGAPRSARAPGARVQPRHGRQVPADVGRGHLVQLGGGLLCGRRSIGGMACCAESARGVVALGGCRPAEAPRSLLRSRGRFAAQPRWRKFYSRTLKADRTSRVAADPYRLRQPVEHFLGGVDR